MMRSRYLSILVAVAAVLFAPGAFAQAEQQKLVGAAETTFSNFVRDPDMKWFKENIGRAKAVIIAPEIVKAGFILGGSGGRAVVVAKDPKTGKWVGPAFYSLATGSIGFQAGVEVSESVTLVMSDKGMSSLLSKSFKMGADASIAAGPVGAGAKSVAGDLVAFSRAKGVYGGLNLDGTAVKTSDDWNDTYYGKKNLLPPDILVRMSVQNPGAEKLLADVTKAASGK